MMEGSESAGRCVHSFRFPPWSSARPFRDSCEGVTLVRTSGQTVHSASLMFSQNPSLARSHHAGSYADHRSCLEQRQCMLRPVHAGQGFRNASGIHRSALGALGDAPRGRGQHARHGCTVLRRLGSTGGLGAELRRVVSEDSKKIEKLQVRKKEPEKVRKKRI